MPKKRFLSTIVLAIVLIFSLCPVAYCFVAGEYSFQGAAVGKVIGYDQNTGTYVVYGRLSTLTDTSTGTSYQVYKTGCFLRVQAMNDDVANKLKNIGQGVKIFGPYETVHNGPNQEKIMGYEAYDYDPANDAGVIEPAYGSTGPYNWTGFGISTLAYEGHMTNVETPGAVVDMLAELEPIILKNGRLFKLDNGNPVIIDSSGKEYTVNDVVNALYTDPSQVACGKTAQPVFLPADYSASQYRAYLKEMQTFWGEYFKLTYFLEQNSQALSEATQAAGGSCYMYGLRGITNNYIQAVPVIRPDVDKFMNVVENQTENPYVQWASPAVFYGKIDKTTPTEYIGPYFPDAHKLVDSIAESSQNGSLNTQGDENLYKQSEKWQIGWDSRESLCVKSPSTYTVEYPQMTAWISGKRVLVYRITVYPPKGDPYSYYEHVTQGKLNTENPPPDRTIRYVGNYVAVDHIITKPAYNFMLSLIREIAIKGGI